MPTKVLSLELSSGAFSLVVEAGVTGREVAVELAGVVPRPDDEEAMMEVEVDAMTVAGGTDDVGEAGAMKEKGKGKKSGLAAAKGAQDASRCGRSEIEEEEGEVCCVREEEKCVGTWAKVVTRGSAALGLVEERLQQVGGSPGC